MGVYIARRIIQAIIVLIIVFTTVFLGVRLLPGDPILMYYTRTEMQSISPERAEILRHQHGLDKSVPVQYIDWVSNLFRGDLGRSIARGDNVTSLIARSLPITLYLGLWAFLISLFLGIFVGVISAVRRGRWLDTAATLLANIGITLPIFWLGIIMIYFLGLKLMWFPIQGFTSPLNNFWLSIRQTAMPVFCLSVFAVASAARQTRSSMLEVIGQDYIRTAMAKGLRERAIILKHALKNAIIPVITLKGISLRELVGGSVIVETVFNIPGMGRLSVEAILDQDYAVIQGVVLIVALVVTFSNLLVDISYGWLDPRVRYS